MSDHDFESKLQQGLNALPKESAPERDLWPGIEHALNAGQGSHTSWRKVSGLAASVMLVGLLGWLSLSHWQQSHGEQQLATLMTTQHQQQKNALLATYAEQPALTDNWQQQLAELDEAAGAIRMALEQDPQNMALLKMLQQVHQQQIDLIERVHAPKYQQI
ncbi:hypothetical protein [Lacimicrobium alkaliphilum]|uniref:Anti-sigma factor n=1 Tax=Lacimicrobium alkaliphilum TaxID=1526571 RepID=A0ABQ1RGI6_9ALTE|nr:hypothetical protein [Lacimicrobium alkaliphilum]GGD67407.1 hypothetical protein GCM10011357_23230 [Lacimicrobium alkaliphilum]